MPAPDAPTKPRSASLRPAVLLALIVLVVRVLYLLWLCPYNLVEDEAHYWLWAHHLDWSYYSKGPGIAWAIALATALFGDAEWAIRLPAVVAGSIGAIAVAGLTRDVVRPEGPAQLATPSKAAFFAAAAFLLAPAFQLTGILVTIDGCYLACWALACWAAWRALMARSFSAWAALGLALAIGFWFKYTILLLPPGILLFAFWQRRRGLRLHTRWSRGVFICLLLAMLGLAPVLIWNAREGWPTVRHLLGHLGVAGGDMPINTSATTGWNYNPKWTVNYLLAPFGMIGPLLVLSLMAIRRHLRPKRTVPPAPLATQDGTRFFAACALPLLLFYLAVSFIAEPEQNWAIAAFVSLTALAGRFAADELVRRRLAATDPSLAPPQAPRTRPAKLLWRLSVYYGLVAAPILLRTDLAARTINSLRSWPLIAGVERSLAGAAPRPIVAGRLIGSREMSLHIAELLEQLRRDTPSSVPFVMAAHYGRASQIAYYLHRSDDPARVFSPQSIMGGRRTQFDLWPLTRLDRPHPELLGQPAVLLSNDEPATLERWRTLFESVEPIDTPDHRLRGEHKKDRVAYIGHGYRGPALTSAAPGNPRR